MDSLKPLYDVLEIYKKEHEKITGQTRRKTIHKQPGQPSTQLRRQCSTTKTNEVTTTKQYYCAAESDEMILSTKDKIQEARNANVLAEVNRVMTKKQNSLQNLRKRKEEKIGRISRALVSAKDRLDMLVVANKNQPETKTSEILKQERKVKNLSEELAKVQREEQAHEVKKQHSLNRLSRRISSASRSRVHSGILER